MDDDQKSSKDVRPQIVTDDELNIIKDICNSNGISHSQLESTGLCVRSLEMFFSGLPTLYGFNFFPNLNSLVIVGQSIKKIENLSSCVNLQELWICECKIKKIQNLDPLKKLTKLYLYNNEISTIENLNSLLYIDELDLSNNKISEIKGLSSLKHLHSLNLGGNYIKNTGNGLSKLTRLESLNLAGNCFSSFQEVIKLNKLPSLKYLVLKDSLYKDNPVCLLCNYTTYILFHFPDLRRLDSIDIVNEQLRELAISAVNKKKLYYKMRIKAIERNLTSIKNCLHNEKTSLLQLPRNKIRDLNFCLKSLQQQMENENVFDESNKKETYKEMTLQELKDKLSNSKLDESDQKVVEDFKHKRQELNKRISSWNYHIRDVDQYHEETVNILKHVVNTSKKRLLLELQSGGNIRFQPGNSESLWYQTCNDLVLSRFCAYDYKSYGITSVRVHGITKVYNRALKRKFDINVTERLGDEFTKPNQKTYSKMIDYLFHMPKKCHSGDLFGADSIEILERGYTSNEMVDNVFPLTNSLFLSEQSRLDYFHKKSSFNDFSCYRHSQVLVSKVFVGKTARIQGDYSKSKVTQNSKVDSFYKNRKNVRNERTKDTDCECSFSQVQHFICKPYFILPEYVVDIEYVFEKAMSPYQQKIGEWLSSALVPSFDVCKPTRPTYDIERLYLEERRCDDEVMSMEPTIQQRPRVVTLSDAILLKIGHATSLKQITRLNLHGNGLVKLRGVCSLTQLKTFTVSFNDLSSLEDIAHLSLLESVDASFNRITTLEGVKGLPKLKQLDVDWNQLTCLRDDLVTLKKHAPNITHFSLKNNPWNKQTESFNLRVIAKLKSLQMLDGQVVSRKDTIDSSKLVAGTKVSSSVFATCSRTDKVEPNTLDVHSTAQSISSMSILKPDIKQVNWMHNVTVLNLNNQFLSKVGGVENMKNLKWATMNNNCITKLEGIDMCSNIEELHMKNNCIKKLDGLHKLTKVVKLDLSGNFISSLESSVFKQLKKLESLSIENNHIATLVGLTEASALTELFIGNNNLCFLREVFYLKCLANLVILDMFGNSMSQVENYRLFVVYHLQNLKSLDGNIIEIDEESAAKESLGGRLSDDFVIEKLNTSNFEEIMQIDFPNFGIKSVDITPQHFFNLCSVNLENNNLTTFSGLVNLSNLKVLCLNKNQIDCIIPRSGLRAKQQIRSQYAYLPIETEAKEKLTPVMENLEVLHLGYNQIKHLPTLQLGRLTSLKTLFLQGNQITKIEGFEGLHQLEELVLDRNKLKTISENSFSSLCKLKELHLEENRISDLSNFSCMGNLQKLFLGMNRIQEIGELEKLESFVKLEEISVIGNAVARRLLHRPLLIFQLHSIKVIDGLQVTPEERSKAEAYFFDQQVAQYESVLPGIPAGRKEPASRNQLKITNVNALPLAHIIPQQFGRVENKSSSLKLKDRMNLKSQPSTSPMLNHKLKNTGSSFPRPTFGNARRFGF